MHSWEQYFFDSKSAIERWFQVEWFNRSAPIYSSVDVRNAGFKIAPVDTNLFPGGWNNLTAGMRSLAAASVRKTIARAHHKPQRLLIVPENHTRNLFYLRNVVCLQDIFRQAGLQVRMGTLSQECQQPTEFTLPDGERLLLEPVIRQRQRLYLADFDPCVVLLNQDLSAGPDDALIGLKDQLLIPPLDAGWHVRRKHVHFDKYARVIERFAAFMGLDPWFFSPMSSHCDAVDFNHAVGMDRLQSTVDQMLHAIRAKYHEHGIHDQPFLIVKADSGTYGMGVMTVRDAKELEQLNRKTRNKMSVIKDGKSVTEVLIQEGVPSLERVGNAVAEPVVYLMNGEMVGGFYRSHPTRGVDENLNASGASFTPLKMSRDDQMPPHFYANGVIARLATMAAADEMDAPPFACHEAFPSESLDLMCTMPSATCKTFSNHFSSSLS